MLQETNKYGPFEACNADETGLFFNLQHSKCLTFHGGSCHGGKYSMHAMLTSVIKLPLLVTSEYQRVSCLRILQKLPKKYDGNTKSWMTTMIFEDDLTQLDKKKGAKKSYFSLTNVLLN
jgi:hypothetical protein